MLLFAFLIAATGCVALLPPPVAIAPIGGADARIVAQCLARLWEEDGFGARVQPDRAG